MVKNGLHNIIDVEKGKSTNNYKGKGSAKDRENKRDTEWRDKGNLKENRPNYKD